MEHETLSPVGALGMRERGKETTYESSLRNWWLVVTGCVQVLLDRISLSWITGYFGDVEARRLNILGGV